MWKRLKDERGSVNIGGVMLLGIAMLIAAVGAYFINPLISGFDDARTHANISSFTALGTVVQIGPTLIVLGYVIGMVAGASQPVDTMYPPSFPQASISRFVSL